MRFLLACARKDLRRRLADPVALVLWIGIPLLVGVLMASMFGGRSAGPPKARVLLVDEDASAFGQLLAGAASGGGGGSFDIDRVSRDEGEALMEAGGASAMLVLPRGLTDAVLEDRPAALTLVRNPAERILPAIVQTAVEMLVEMVFYLQRLLGEPARALRAEAPEGGGFFPDRAVALFSGSVNERLRRAGEWLLPPALDVEFVDTSPDRRQPTDIGALFLPSMLFMAMMFVAQGMADDLWDEKEAGTLRRAATLPHALTPFLAGKLVTAALVVAAVAAVGLGVLYAMDAVTARRAPGVLAWAVFSGTALFCFFLLLQFAASTRRGAAIAGSVVLFPMVMIGGAFFPFEAMPPWMRAIGQWTPNGQALVRFKDLAAGTATAGELAIAGLAIGLPAAAAFLLSARLMRGRFASEA